MTSEEELECVESDFVFLDVGVHQDQTFDLVVNAVTNEIVLQQKLLSENESKVGLAKQLVNELVVFANQLVQDVLQGCSNVGEGEDIVPALVLHFFVLAFVECRFFDRRQRHALVERSAEL